MKIDGENMYQVKSVSTHGHREETIMEIITALDHITAITKGIFSSIEEKIQRHQAHVTALTSRAAIAAEQVCQLKSSVKGIKILSSAKYFISFPEEDPGGLLCSFPSLRSNTIPPQGSSATAMQTNGGNGIWETSHSKLYKPAKGQAELLQFYHVRGINVTNCSIERCENSYNNGLGTPSLHLDTADSFQSFCSAENPYQKYIVPEKEATSSFSTKVSRPINLMQSESMQTDVAIKITSSDSKVDDFYYKPTSREIPDIDVPDFLPNLPGIADAVNLGFQDSIVSKNKSPASFESIAPVSLVPTSTVVDSLPFTPRAQYELSHSLPKIDEVDNSFSNAKPQFDTSENGGGDAPSAVPVPIAPCEPKTTIVSSASVVTLPVPPPPPPPPPLPPMLLSDIPDNVHSQPEPKPKPERANATKNKLTPLQPPTASKGDARSSLMEAIRQAGGSAKLRSARAVAAKQEVNTNSKKQEDNVKTPRANNDGPDLMADLKNSLAMRRRGISGIDARNQSGLDNIMSKLAATIPKLDDSIDEDMGGATSDNDDWDV